MTTYLTGNEGWVQETVEVKLPGVRLRKGAKPHIRVWWKAVICDNNHHFGEGVTAVLNVPGRMEGGYKMFEDGCAIIWAFEEPDECS